MKALLALEDGRTFAARSFTGEGEAEGEVVFNTAMTGYQEILTDPSYRGQIITMTYPLMGNCGANPEDFESAKVQAAGLVVREFSTVRSNWRADRTLADLLDSGGILGVDDVDTRALTRHIRLAGAMKGIISTRDPDPERLAARARALPGLVGVDLACQVSCREPYLWRDHPAEAGSAALAAFSRSRNGGAKVAVLDCGVKYNILRSLAARGAQVLVLPATTPAADILALSPDGLLISNGPGDPAAVRVVVATVRELLGKLPIFGICLGQQMLGLALGGTTYKLKFGHRGANHPVKNLATGRIEITSQNHGFTVDIDSLAGTGAEVTHLNLNDNTLEGFRCPKLKLFSVQYHPEASPGPHDSSYLFDDFFALMGATAAP
ncbi:MAG: glutamine-hydrolyzing carbamoyl-phosphate synthase small subunit [Pseudomonadota bacterium]